MKNEKNRIVILKHNGGRLANQLWNYMSIYAYCLEEGYSCFNPSFFEYFGLFPKQSSKTNILSCINKILKTLIPERYAHQIVTLLYSLISEMILCINYNKVVDSGRNGGKPFFLPPTSKAENIIGKLNGTHYFVNWFFRNPVGIKKYRKEIVELFTPTEQIINITEKKIREAKRDYKHVVGVHFRQGDYKSSNWKHLYLKAEKIKEAMGEYINHNHISIDDVLFIFCSDGTISKNDFKDFYTIYNGGSMMEDLFLLSKTDAILGSDSTFGAFSSFYGNIPLIVMTNKKIDWKYYEDKHEYFENKYNTTVCYS